MDILLNILLTLFAVFIGGIITWVVAKRYYVKASHDLERESAQLRRMHQITLNVLERSGLRVDVDWDNPELPERIPTSVAAQVALAKAKPPKEGATDENA